MTASDLGEDFDDEGDDESSTQTFTFDSVERVTVNSPAVLLPLDDNRVTDAGEAIVINAAAADPENDPIDYAASFGDLESAFNNFQQQNGGTYADFVAAGNGPVTDLDGVGELSVDQSTGNVTFTPAERLHRPGRVHRVRPRHLR